MKTKITKQDRNKLRTPGYFIKRLKDNGYITLRMFQKYASSDPRKWTVLVDPGNFSGYITCFENKNEPGEILFQVDDGGRLFPPNFYIKTHSMEVVINNLIERGVVQSTEDSIFYKSKDEENK